MERCENDVCGLDKYKQVVQLHDKDENSKEYPIFPVTYTHAVYDGKTGANLESMLAQFNNVFLQYQGTAKDTRLLLPKEMRRKSVQITYRNMDDEVVTEKCVNDSQSDNDHWGLDANWMRIDELSLQGDISVSKSGTWIINGADTGVKALGPKGDNGLTPWMKTIDNKLYYSYDNQTWELASDYIAAWFRFTGTSGSSQANNVGKIQISRDEGKTWADLSGTFTNNLHIKGYVATTSDLPSSAVQGDIYGVGPTYAESDTEHTNPIYKLFVKNENVWVDNGQFTSIAAGVVQELGESETEVVSQKVVTDNVIKPLITNTFEQSSSNISVINSYSASAGDVIRIYVEENTIPNQTFLIRLMKGGGVVTSLYQGKIENDSYFTTTLTADIDGVQIMAIAPDITGSLKFVINQNIVFENLKLNSFKKESIVQELGDSETKVMSQKSVSDELENKVNVSLGVNLFNAAAVKMGYILNAIGNEVVNVSSCISDYIVVNQQNLIRNTAFLGANNAVYDERKTFLRSFTTSNYTYQEGDYFVRYSVAVSSLDTAQIEYGDEVTEYHPYTTSQDVIDILQDKIEEKENKTSILSSNRLNNYAYTAFTKASDTLTYIRLFSSDENVLKGKYLLKAIVIAESVSNFSDQVKVQLGTYLWQVSKTIDFTSSTYKYIFINTGSVKHYISSITIEALNDIALEEVKKYQVSNEKDSIFYNVLEVHKNFDETTEGFGTVRFNNPITAHDYITASSPYNRFIIRLANGNYKDEIQEAYKGSDSETGTNSIGIKLKNYEYFESFYSDDSPELTIFEWDGTYGFSDSIDWSDEANRDKIRNRAIFQIAGANNFTTSVKGIHIKGVNLRYAIHPEVAQTGWNHNWTFENCIIEFDGRQVFDEPNIAIIGTGIGKGTTGNVVNCEFRGISNSAIGGHDNPASSAATFIIRGAELNIIGCKFNNKTIGLTTLYSDGDTPDAIYIKNTGGISSITVGSSWKYASINSEIGTV